MKQLPSNMHRLGSSILREKQMPQWVKKFPASLRNLVLHHHVHESVPLLLVMSQATLVHTLPSYLRSIILSSNVCLGFQMASFLQGLLPKPCMHVFSPWCVTAISSSDLITIIIKRVWCTNHEVPHYAVFSGVLLLHLRPRCLHQHPVLEYPQSVLVIMWWTKFRNRVRQAHILI